MWICVFLSITKERSNQDQNKDQSNTTIETIQY